ncbi:hypothetical protein G3O08_20460 [Cryomorpha ignava]|uniref:Erythromycin esterase family protein n=1 Tax=Cryomorpha ignava TaxID=101383 RepID=A0A7K3WW16_9FLAO|nr:hypothetical protein [Cryomorpha ignava]NEN25867.1 hypothetical protein [Cryomorpha ignava]
MKTRTANNRTELVIVLMFFFTSFSTLEAQDEIVSSFYLGTNTYNTDGLKILDDLIAEQNFVFTSELHYHPYSLESQKKFIAYLSAGNQLDILGLEGDYALGYEINHFLETGDTLRLKTLFDLHPEMMVRTETADFYKHYIAVKAMRDSMQTDFGVKGLDVCYGGGFKGSIFTIIQILEMSSDSTLFKTVEEGKLMLQKKRLGDNRVRNWVKVLKIKLNDAEPTFLQSIGDYNLAELSNILFNIEQSLEVKKGKMKERELEISHNFKRYCYPDERVFVQFGYSHVFANLENRYGINENTFIGFLNQDSTYANRSIVIQFMPWEGTKAYFPLLTDTEKEQIAPVVLKRPFPQLVDFRYMQSIERAFDFSIIVSGSY